MPCGKSLYGERVSSSGLIYAVIVGAWAAYLVPMWLRRQDELNEARPTERFSTAIRLLSGRAAMERRYAKELQGRIAGEAEADAQDHDGEPEAATESLSSVDVRSFAAPPALTEARIEVQGAPPVRTRRAAADPAAERAAHEGLVRNAEADDRDSRERANRARRSQLLARRRRTTVVLFVAFTLGAVAAAVGGLDFLWAPGVPAVLLSIYIAHLRRNERRRFAYTMDRRRAEAAAQRLRETGRRRQPPADGAARQGRQDAEHAPQPRPAHRLSPQEAGRRALVEQTDHAEWIDQQRERRPSRGESWEPVPVPLPTYVTAPVAPRATSGVDVSDPETWSAARSSASDPAPQPEARHPEPRRPEPRQAPRRARDHGRTPLFDQYDESDRPRAANE